MQAAKRQTMAMAGCDVSRANAKRVRKALMRTTWVVAIAIVLFGSFAFAQVPTLKNVPDTLPVEIRTQLNGDYAALASHLDAIQKQLQTHNRKCTPIQAG